MIYFFILTFCNFNWLEEEVIYNLAIYHHGYIGIHGKEGVISNKKHLTIVKLDDYYYLLCCITDLHIVSFSLSELPGSHRWCLRFYTALLSQNFYISRAITAS